MAENYFIFAGEICQILNVGETKAYSIIKELNEELKQKGFLVMRGRCPRKYFFERLGVSEGITV
ncbi:MAG: LysR family transcriptional regulator [Eubacterium sp.]|nr:LysR family transcriptional regulator [Eubacterium sp.]